MAFSGLLALLDDMATIADDVASLTALAAKKTAGVVTDDMAVTAEQTLGIAREREIPVVLAVAKGSLFNKGVLLVPGALALNAVAPWAISPILMAGGAFLSFEGVEKVLHARKGGHEAHADAAPQITDPAELEKLRVSGAIRTDLILSGEIVAITLGQVSDAPFLTQAATLYAVSLIMTFGVYGIVGLLVKLDDIGEAIALRGGPSAALGRAIVAGTPKLLHAISIIGTVAMLMVGGHIILEGIPPLAHLVHDLLHALPGLLSSLVGLLTDVAIGALVGLAVVGLLATGLHRRLLALLPRRGAGRE